jgi:hypothetical protein
VEGCCEKHFFFDFPHLRGLVAHSDILLGPGRLVALMVALSCIVTGVRRIGGGVAESESGVGADGL